MAGLGSCVYGERAYPMFSTGRVDSSGNTLDLRSELWGWKPVYPISHLPPSQLKPNHGQWEERRK